MNLAKLSANGQITVPVEIRRLLRLDPGDKLLFTQNANGEVVMTKATTSSPSAALQHGGAPALDPEDEKDPIQRLIEELRGHTPSS